MESWTSKYRPKSLDDVSAQGRAMKEIRKWADQWESGRPKKPALLFYGPPGVGKSSAAHALAKEKDWDLIELNASDERTKSKIERKASTAANYGSLTGKKEKRLIVLDEADNVHGNADRGGKKAISKLLNESKNPIILIGNDQYEIPQNIKRKCNSVNFRRLRKSSIAKVLRKIAKKEGINADPKVLQKLGERSNGDLRSAINDFQAIASGRKRVSVEDISTENRDREISIFKLLGKLKKTRDVQEAREAIWNLDETPDETIDWIEENLPKIMGNIPDLADAFEKVSRADIFLGRAKRMQIYNFWKYASDLMSAGVAVSRKGKPGKGRFGYPSSRKTYGRSKKKRKIRDNLLNKISNVYHVSSRTAINDFLPYLSTIFKNAEDSRENISRGLELERKEEKYLQDY
ncbi:MAG: replication factor C large subunit [Candidatus Hadarchaeia archaeon]